ncbi:BspA family leucine-rich repeat surface protein [Lactobacillus jensenii]|uniref:BspA family leucine-rich repeat surface protein n=1 Tax=Lactobacillus jensenii TaxID=109790 RepID=UPI00254E7B81|nr:BspA family leucine-rich repeat surface protein [Lactobacillus jensenii]MDK6782664.1 BspA family leucine-rich repeat surface protein [Lactobacillus jensenii]
MTKEFVFDKKEFDKWEIQKDENNNPILVSYKDTQNKTLYVPNQADLAPFGVTGKVKIPVNNLNWQCENRENVIISNKDNKKVGLFSPDGKHYTYGLFSHEGKATLKKIDLRGLDISKITNLDHLFYGQKELESINMEGIDTSNVTLMQSTFAHTPNLKEVKGLENLDTSNVKYMDSIFLNSGIKNLDISNWNTRSLVSAREAFKNMNFKNLDLSNWNFSHVTDTTKMFKNSTGTISLPKSGANSLKVADSMFENSDLIIENMDKFKMPKLLTAISMFSDYPYHWEVAQVDNPMQLAINNIGNNLENTMNMFAGVWNTNENHELDISKLNLSKAKNTNFMFAKAKFKIEGLKQLRINNKCNTDYMFYGINDEDINTKRVKRAQNRFAKARKIARAQNLGREL